MTDQQFVGYRKKDLGALKNTGTPVSISALFSKWVFAEESKQGGGENENVDE